MSSAKEIREKTKLNLLNKWEKINIYPKVNIYEGNFVPIYHSLLDLTASRAEELFIGYNIDAIQYHIRMLDETRKYVKRIHDTIHLPFMDTKEGNYAVQRLDNTITLLENHRATLFWLFLKIQIAKLIEAKTKKEMLYLDKHIQFYFSRHFDKNGFVIPYLSQ